MPGELDRVEDGDVPGEQGLGVDGRGGSDDAAVERLQHGAGRAGRLAHAVQGPDDGVVSGLVRRVERGDRRGEGIPGGAGPGGDRAEKRRELTDIQAGRKGEDGAQMRAHGLQDIGVEREQGAAQEAVKLASMAGEVVGQAFDQGQAGRSSATSSAPSKCWASSSTRCSNSATASAMICPMTSRRALPSGRKPSRGLPDTVSRAWPKASAIPCASSARAGTAKPIVCRARPRVPPSPSTSIPAPVLTEPRTAAAGARAELARSPCAAATALHPVLAVPDSRATLAVSGSWARAPATRTLPYNTSRTASAGPVWPPPASL